MLVTPMNNERVRRSMTSGLEGRNMAYSSVRDPGETRREHKKWFRPPRASMEGTGIRWISRLLPFFGSPRLMLSRAEALARTGQGVGSEPGCTVGSEPG